MNRLYVISLTAVGSMSLVAAMIVPAKVAPKPAPTPTVSAKRQAHNTGDERALLLKADGAGQFHINAQVNSSPVQFLIDTGANMVALTEDEAARLGIMVTPGDFQPIMQTASGIGYGAPVTIDTIEISGVELHRVDAVVVRDLPINLLGQSVLKQLGSVEMRGDTMVLQPK